LCGLTCLVAQEVAAQAEGVPPHISGDLAGSDVLDPRIDSAASISGASEV